LPWLLGAPDLVGCKNLAHRLAWVAVGAAVEFDRHQPVPLEDIACRGAAWETPPRMPLVQQRQELFAAPVWVPASGVQDRAHNRVGRLIRRAHRPPRALLETRWPI